MTVPPQASEYRLRPATAVDVPEIVRVTNRAYRVEQFCLRGDRTDETDVSARMRQGRFLVIEAPEAPSVLCASVFMSMAAGRGFLGTLAVAPDCQGRGLARALVEAVEDQCRRADCAFLDLSVVNLRTELFPFYAKLGFTPSGILPFPKPEKVLLPLHLVQLSKPLRAAVGSTCRRARPSSVPGGW